MNGVAVLAMAGVIASCSREVEVYQPTKEEKMANAEAQLGVKIDPNQDWRMIARATATVTVNGDVNIGRCAGAYRVRRDSREKKR